MCVGIRERCIVTLWNGEIARHIFQIPGTVGVYVDNKLIN